MSCNSIIVETVPAFLENTTLNLDMKVKEFRLKSEQIKKKKGGKSDSSTRSAEQIEEHLKTVQRMRRIALNDPQFIKTHFDSFKALDEEMDRYLKNPGTLSISKALNDIYKKMGLEGNDGEEPTGNLMSESELSTQDPVRDYIIGRDIEAYEFKPVLASKVESKGLMEMFKTSYVTRPTNSDLQPTSVKKERISVEKHSILPGMEQVDEEIMPLYENETLFFIFYHQGDPLLKVMAAQELKKREWRFHKKFMVWFRRLNNQVKVEENCEKGDFLMFDSEDTWKLKKKANFTFEYKYLEDDI